MKFGLKEEVIQQVQRVFSHYPQIQQAILYGSRAMDTHKVGSDIDLSLKGENLDLHLLSQLDDELDELLLPYTFDISIFDDISNSDLIDHIARVGILFYSKS